MQLVPDIVEQLGDYRVAERDAVIPFMNGEFTTWDLYLATSCEYSMRLIDGFIPILETRNFVCAEQLLRAQIGVCMRTLGLFVCEDVNEFLKTFVSGGRIDLLKDKEGKMLSDSRLKELLNDFDPTILEMYNTASGFTHFSSSVVTAMAVAGDDSMVEFNFGMELNDEINSDLLVCGSLFIRYLDLHLQMLKKVVESDEWYADRMEL